MACEYSKDPVVCQTFIVRALECNTPLILLFCECFMRRVIFMGGIAAPQGVVGRGLYSHHGHIFNYWKNKKVIVQYYPDAGRSKRTLVAATRPPTHSPLHYMISELNMTGWCLGVVSARTSAVLDGGDPGP